VERTVTLEEIRQAALALQLLPEDPRAIAGLERLARD
jgi:hypothetical protein